MNSTRFREQELQGIIRTQESKIHSLQKEIGVVKSQEEQHIAEALARQKRMIEEKDKTIKMLMEQAQKSREDSKSSYSSRMAQIEGMYRSSQQMIQRQERDKQEVQAKIAMIKEHYEFEIKEKQKQKEELAYQLEVYQRQRRSLLDEVQKLNKFYAESSRRQPEREETLLWVDKLIEFISKTNEIIANEGKERQQTLLSITLHITHQLKQLNMEYSKNDTIISTERLKFLQDLQDLIQKAEKDYNEAVKSNIEFGDNLVRVKNREEKQMIQKLESQLLQIKDDKEKELNKAYEMLASVEKDKKNLLVNIQELKSYYELRQRSSRQEVDFLKKAMQQLLEGQDVRQQQFQKEIERMREQIQHLTVTFYQKIQLPINTVYNKIKEEVSKFKLHYQGFFSDSNLQRQIENFQLHIVQYLTSLNQQKDERELIKETGKQALRIINFVTSSNFRDTDVTHRKEQASPKFHSVPQEKKLNYELATARKQIQKLKEHTKLLQSKSPKSRTPTMSNNTILELAAENQLLKERIDKLQRNQKDNFMYNEQLLTESRIGRVNTAILERLEEKIVELLSFTSKEEKYIITLSGCINSLNQIIINPVETFQQLLDQIKNISTMAVIPHHEHTSAIFQVGNTAVKKQVYRDILVRKNEANINIHKTNVELMKVLRQLQGKKEGKQSKVNETQLQNQKPRALQSKQMLEKRVKEVHGQRLKMREQVLEKLLLLEERVRTMEAKTTKKQNFSFIKFEESICKKLQEMFSSLTSKEKLKDIDKISKGALNDARVKLKDCQAENEGLLRQIYILKQVKGLK